MSPQLLYIYLHKLGTCYEQQNFIFTNEFDITYKPASSELKLAPKNNPYEGLWNERIHNINLIIGKNGAGKSTLLDLLGSVKQNRVNRFPFEENRWFAIYHVVAETFLIEGYHSELLGNVQGLPLDIDVEYCITVKYEQETGQLFASDYIQHATNNQSYPIRELLLPLYLASGVKQPWYSGQSNRSMPETYVGFQREYLDQPHYANLYQFMTKEYRLLEQDYTIADALLSLNREEDIFPAYSTIEEKKKLLDLNLYNKKAEALIFKPDVSIRLYHTSDPQDRWTAKEKFIIRHLEAALISLWIRLKQSRNKEGLQTFRSLLAKIKLDSDGLIGRTKYLLQALRELQNSRTPVMNEFNLRLDCDALERIIWDLIELDERYFISSKAVTVSLKEDMDPHLVRFLQHYDNENPRVGGSSLHVSFKRMSTGELEFINGFANLYKAVHQALGPQVETILLLIDEPDASFHPEWSRRYIANLVKFLGQGHFTRPVKFQILLTTHSPFMVSDVPKEHINCIKITNNSGKIKRVVQQADFGLMSNIYDIMKSDFFIGAPIGEFATQVFKHMLYRIERLDAYDSLEVEQISRLIDGIGEDVLRKKLTQMLNDRIAKLEPELLQMKKIEQLEKELKLEREKLNRQRKGRNSND
ncbi:AAA family ATPase [Paenibacillus sp. OAE614]|uniref:AAA family ATPase n=1 Tax=Paenibacillus sp. OAE614 TaxID=2663804 RepID=UPI00178BD8E8